MLTRKLGFLTIPTGFALVYMSCAAPSSTTRTTNAQKYAAGSPDLRTVDNAGYVDPGGRTAQVSAGGTTTTERGANAVAPQHRETPSGSETTANVPPAPPGPPVASSSADPIEFTERAARALCDRETYCDRIGAGKTFESADACMVAKRDRVRRAMNERSCKEIRGDGVSRCLNAVRGAECGPAGAPLQPPPACTADALCK